MKIEKVELYKVNGAVFMEERSAKMYLARHQLEQALTEDGILNWMDISPVEIVDWIKQNRKKVLDYLELIGE